MRWFPNPWLRFRRDISVPPQAPPEGPVVRTVTGRGRLWGICRVHIVPGMVSETSVQSQLLEW